MTGSFKTLILASMLALASSGTALAQEAQPEYRGSIFVPPEPSPEVPEDEPEMSSDIEFFAAAGYTVPDFNVYYNLRHDVAREILVPDYTKRTGMIPPDDVRLEVASAHITGGDFNDIILYSFLPGDCDTGCLAQVYRTTDGKTWKKVLEFKSLAFAYRGPGEGKGGEVVAVGNEELPSRIFEWNGIAFVEK